MFYKTYMLPTGDVWKACVFLFKPLNMKDFA